MSDTDLNRFPPKEVTSILRLEGLVVLIGALAGYQFLGGNWLLFALLVLLPDLAMLGALTGTLVGTRLYNLAHTYALPGLLAIVAVMGGQTQLLSFMFIWVAHIAMDRTLGYGLKYPGLFQHTHLGRMGNKANKKGTVLAHAR